MVSGGSTSVNRRAPALLHGGWTIRVRASIDALPLFGRAGSIIPTGTAVESTDGVQKTAKVRVYAGAVGNFTLYQNGGKTYAYEKGEYKITHLNWNDAKHRFCHQGASAWTGPDSSILEVIVSE